MNRFMWLLAVTVTLIPVARGQSQDFLPGDVGGMSVEYMRLKPEFGPNPAYTTGALNLPPSRRRTVDFTHGHESAYRFNLDFVLNESLLLRGSWSQLDQAQTLTTTNSNPNFLVQSALVMERLQINSPETFRFIPNLPTFTLFDTPPRRLPPFPFPNSLTLGFGPDQLSFTNSYRLSTGNLELVTESGGGFFRLGMGAQFAEFDQRYRAFRFNPGGTFLNLPTFDPIALQMIDGALTIANDTSTLDYRSSFTGGGPRFSLQSSFPLLSWLELYGSFRGSVLFGNRKESANLAVLQQVVFFETVVNFNVTIPLSGTEIRSLERSSFSVVPFGEAEIGLSMRLSSEESIIRPFFRISAVGQFWGGVGSATNANSNLILTGYNATLGVNF